MIIRTGHKLNDQNNPNQSNNPDHHSDPSDRCNPNGPINRITVLTLIKTLSLDDRGGGK
jgi:hypothetical protein